MSAMIHAYTERLLSSESGRSLLLIYAPELLLL
jgi:hypothetical protein